MKIELSKADVALIEKTLKRYGNWCNLCHIVGYKAKLRHIIILRDKLAGKVS